MQPTNGMDRAQFHDKAWAMWQEKALGSALLPKLSIHAIRTLWDVLYDSMATLSAPAQGEPEAPVSGLSRTQCNAIEYFVTQMRGVESAVYADMFDAFLGYINSLVGPVLTPQPAPAVAKEGMTGEEREAIKYARSVMGSVSWETRDSKAAKDVLDALLAKGN